MSEVKNVNASEYIAEYNYHVAENVIYTKDGKLLTTLEIDGFPYESINDSEIVNEFSNMKNFFVGLGKQGNLFIWSHIIKKRMILKDSYQFINNTFLQGFADKYVDTLRNGDFFKTSYFLTFGISVSSVGDSINDGIEKLQEIIQQTKSVFSKMNVRSLGVRDDYVSEVASDYLSFLVNHQIVDIPLSGTRIKETITNSDIFFGFDVAEIKSYESEKNIFCSNYVIKDFPRSTSIGQWDFLLKLPYEFVLTQSFIAESPTKSLKKLESQLNKLGSTKDAAVTQQEELEVGQEVVQDGSTLFGSYHAVLTVFGDSVDSAKENGVKVSSEFITGGKGFRFIKSTNVAPLTYFSHLPMTKYRPLKSNRTLTNLACLFSLHNFSYGKQYGNPIGDGTAIMPLKTVSDSLYFFNTHYSELYKNVTGQKRAGHALILGASETGKTTFEGTATAFLQRFDPNMFVIDFNRSTELFVRAYGGSYFSLSEGIYTGLNPFQIGNNDDPELISFLKAWVKRGAAFNDGTDCTDSEALQIDSAVDAIMQLPCDLRRFSGLLESIPSDSDLFLRLKKWCGKGALAWALDSEVNTFNPNDYKKVGFDTTVILETVGGKIHPACEMILSVLFFYKNRMQKSGELMLTIVEEFWMPANFPMTQAMIKSALKAGRMKGEMIWLTSQSPEDAINCDIFAAIVQQTSTKIFLPNPDAEWDGYEKMGLTKKEFTLLKSLGKVSRTMLIKQSNASALVKMDLFGFDDYLPIISGSQAGVALCDKIRKETGDNPNDWIPRLLKALSNSND